jgi:hypothetical protein
MKKKSKFIQLSGKSARNLSLFLAVRDLPAMARVIYEVALENDTEFFKQLGKALSHRKNPHLGMDKREAFMLQYYLKKTLPPFHVLGCIVNADHSKQPGIPERVKSEAC